MIVDGKKIQKEILLALESRFRSVRSLSLAVVYVGNDPVIENYVKIKRLFAEKVGVKFNLHHLTEKIPEVVLLQEIKKIADANDGIVIQLPLPKEYNQSIVVNSVPANKDIDMLSEHAYREFEKNVSVTLPPVVGAIDEILRAYNVSLFEKKIAILGYGKLVGKPVHVWLVNQGLLPDLFDLENPVGQNDLLEYDVIISGMGIPNFIKPDMIKEGVILLDAGTSGSGGTVSGDADPDCAMKCALFTPVPGGIGPLTVAMLFKNLLLLNE